jgi:class 3 adenylate cyclase/pimeloyl-ACP methyl ester carboxylesterase
MEIRDTRYAKTTDGVYLAYQVAGEGPIDLAWEFDFIGNVDLAWDWPVTGPLLRALSQSCRVILHDRRGAGLSSRNVSAPNLETRVGDMRLVLDTVGSERPVLAGINEAGAPNVVFAATQPERVRSIVWLDPLPRVVWAPDFQWGLRRPYVEVEERSLDLWGTNDYGVAWANAEAAAESMLSNEQLLMAGMMSRHTATPDMARELDRIWYETDVRAVLPSVRAPTLLIVRDGSRRKVEVAEYVASLMSDATVAAVSGAFGPDEIEPVMNAIRPFLGVESPAPELDTFLATVLFTDIVGSTARQASLGDHRWKDVLKRHHGIAREALTRWRGIENDTAGDGFFATFDGPARAIRCALEIVERVTELGIEIRAGLHTGECELVEGKTAGLTVSIGARVAGRANPSEVLVSQTVKDLVAGSGFVFEDRGSHELRGLPDRWRLYSASLSDRHR